MTPAEHYAEAEKCLEASSGAEFGSRQESLMLRVAQVHATLATVITDGWPVRDSVRVWPTASAPPPRPRPEPNRNPSGGGS